MKPGQLIVLVLAAATAVSVAVLLGVVYGLLSVEPDSPAPALLFWSLMVVALTTFGGWLVLRWRLLAPLAELGRRARRLAESEEAPQIEPVEGLGRIAGDVAALGQALQRARQETAQVVEAATMRQAAQKERLEAILRDLAEGVLVCSADHRILLYNQAALRLFPEPARLGLGRSLFDLINREPVLHCLEQFKAPQASPREGQARAFVTTPVAAPTLLQGRMSLIREPDGVIAGYVLTFSDISRQMVDLGRHERLLRAATEGLRAPLASLRAAAEMLGHTPELSEPERRRFERVLLEESAAISDRIEALAGEAGALPPSGWPTTDVHSMDLLNCLARECRDNLGIEVTIVGLPLWLHGDSHLLLLSLVELLRRLREHSGASRYDIEPKLGDRRVYVDITWTGRPVAPRQLDEWLDAPLPGLLGGSSLRDALSRHGEDLWSLPAGEETALLRVPLAASPSAPAVEPEASLPPRPEFYDFELMRQATRGGALGERLLSELDFVVFDTETTGLRPSDGDEIISLAAVRVVNRRILTGESFEALVDPGRPIPAESTRFHGLTDADVAGRPDIRTVLPRFRDFVGDAVLVGHNVAFDLKFLKLKEKAAGVVFDSPALDTLLLSRFLEPDLEDHSLEAVAHRLGIDVQRRHTALGDTLVTAAIFVRQLELLEARGLTRLGETLRESGSLAEMKRLQAQF